MKIQKIYSEINTDEKLYSVLMSESEMEKIFANNPMLSKEWGIGILEKYAKRHQLKHPEKVVEKVIKKFSRKNFSSSLTNYINRWFKISKDFQSDVNNINEIKPIFDIYGSTLLEEIYDYEKSYLIKNNLSKKNFIDNLELFRISKYNNVISLLFIPSESLQKKYSPGFTWSADFIGDVFMGIEAFD
jgi:hypothetical protein